MDLGQLEATKAAWGDERAKELAQEEGQDCSIVLQVSSKATPCMLVYTTGAVQQNISPALAGASSISEDIASDDLP
jgi:hypothetical protein